MRVGLLTSHPIQYQAPWFRELAERVDLEVFFAHKATGADQAAAGFDVNFEWDTNLTSGYSHTFLRNTSARPCLESFGGCDTPQIADYVQRGSFDAFIISGWYLKSYWQAVFACLRAGVPILLRGDSQLYPLRLLPTRIARRAVLGWLFKRVDGFLSVGTRFSEYLQHHGVGDEKIFFAPHCVDVKWFAKTCAETEDAQEKLRQELGLVEGGLILLFVGKLVDIKRPMDLIAAAGLSGQESTVLYVGDGPLKNHVHDFARQRGVACVTPGFINQSQMPTYYGLADALVVTSQSESWGLAVNEAMACGKPSIVSDTVGCAPDMIREGQTGFVFPMGDCGALADRIRVLPELLARADLKQSIKQVSDGHSIRRSIEGVRVALERVRG